MAFPFLIFFLCYQKQSLGNSHFCYLPIDVLEKGELHRFAGSDHGQLYAMLIDTHKFSIFCFFHISLQCHSVFFPEHSNNLKNARKFNHVCVSLHILSHHHHPVKDSKLSPFSCILTKSAALLFLTDLWVRDLCRSVGISIKWILLQIIVPVNQFRSTGEWK